MLIAITGKKKSGKTKLAEELAKILSEKHCVAYIKHVHHRGEPFDREGSDTQRLTRSGAKAVIGVSPDALFLRMKTEGESLDSALNALKTFLPECGIVLIEGFHSVIARREDILKIYVAQGDEDAISIASEDAKPDVIFCATCSLNEALGIRVLKEAKEVVEIAESRLKGEY